MPGPKGEPAGRKFTFSTTVTDANPGSGFLRFNNATFASITNLFVSTTDGAAGGATEFLDRMGTSSNADKGLIRIQHADNPAIYREFVVTGVTTATSYRKVLVTPLSSSGTLANNTVVMITFAATGNKGTDGTGTGDMSKSTYDPTSKAADAFAMGNMVEGIDAKVMTAAERTKLSGVAAGAQVNTVTSVAGKTGAVAIVAADVSNASANGKTLLTLADYAAMFAALKQAATTAATGVTQLATAANYRGNTAGNLALSPAEVWNAAAFAALTDAATIAVNLNNGFNFSVSLAGNRTLGAPSNAAPGQCGVIAVTASGAARTLAKAAAWKSDSSITWPVSIDSGATAFVYYAVTDASNVIITGVLNNPA